MSATAALDVKGDIRRHPFAELLVELYQARFSGSLRLSNGGKKAVVYIKDGRVVHAVSNARDHRLFSIGLERKAFTKETLARHPNFANDIEFAASLRSAGQITEEDLQKLTVEQIGAILVNLLSWTEGEWIYSPHARLRSDVVSNVDTQSLLIDFARCLPGKAIYDRLRSVDDMFSHNGHQRSHATLQPHEKFVLSRFEQGQLSIAQLRAMSTLPESGLMQAIYALWLGGLIVRRDWVGAFTDQKLEAIRSAKFSRVNEAAALPSTVAENAKDPSSGGNAESTNEAPGTRIPEAEIALPDYLDRVEKAETFYDILGIDTNASAAIIKSAYLTLAKKFHPDRFHRENRETHGRIQNAFTKLAHAYETLKSDESRESYDYKIKKELEIREKRRAAGKPEEPEADDTQAELGLNSFEEGLALFQDEDYEGAATQLARAVHYSPNNALYHAYFGQALSYLGDKYRHKAESEMQSAVKLDPKNSKIRMMLVEFFVDMNLIKRAEGELNRFLEIVPGNREALEMLGQIKQVV